MDEDACWRWAFKRGYGRRPKPGELERYKHWHGISRRDGFDASGPWEAWPSKPTPDDHLAWVPCTAAPAPATERTSRRREVVKAEPPPPRLAPIPACRALVPVVEATAFSDRANFARSFPEPVDKAENQLSGGGIPQVSTEKRADSKPAQKRRGRPPTVQQAQVLLQEHLAGGPKPGAQVTAAAEAAEIPERSLIRAADVLGVRCQRGQWWLQG